MRHAPAAILVAFLALIASHESQPAHAQPGFPASFFGSVAIDGEPVPPGTEVRGFIDGVDCTQLGDNYRTTIIEDGIAQYAIEVVHESQQPGCGDEDKTVTFTVGGRPARETAAWMPGVNVVNLNVGAGTGPTLPPPTATPTLEPAAVAATATEVARFTPITGTPPTDEVSPPGGTRVPATTPDVTAAGEAEGSGEDGGGLLFLGGAIVAILILGVVGGTFLARRKGRKVREP